MRGIFSPFSKGQPWYEAKLYREARLAKAARVKRQQEQAHERAIYRRDYAKKHGLSIHQVTNAMLGFK